MVAGWVFVRVSGWLAMVCTVVQGGLRWLWLDFGRSGGGFRRLFILNQVVGGGSGDCLL